MEEIMGVILAAGKGTRMYPFSARYPKPLLPICNKPLIQYQIETLKALQIKKIIIVIGHLGFEIVRVLGDGSRYDVQIQYIEQPDTLGIAHAVGKLEPYIHSPFMLFLGDIFFKTQGLMPMIELLRRGEANAVLATKYEKDNEAIKRNFAVLCHEDGRVKRVIEKPRYITNNLKGCGLYLFDLHIFDAIRRTPRTAIRDEYEITEAIQILIDDGFTVRHTEVITDDVNMTFAADLLLCNLKELKNQGLHYLIGSNRELNPACKIENSVIGNHVRILPDIEIKNSLIFDHVVIKDSGNLHNLIMSPENVIDCSYIWKNGRETAEGP